MTKLTKSDKQFAEKRVAEKYQQILEKMAIGNRENGESDEYKVSEKQARIELSEFYHNVWIHWHEKAFRYLNQGKSDKEERAWRNCAQAIYAYYIVVTKYESMCCVWKTDVGKKQDCTLEQVMPRSERKGRISESWLLRD